MSVSNIFETLTGVTGLDSQQTALAVQALLDSQSLTEAAAAAVEDDDIFQCGKCKKQFTNFAAFVTHKQTPCTIPQNIVSLRTLTNGLTAAHITNTGGNSIKQEMVASYTAVPSSPLTQALGHNIVLTDDLISFTTQVDQSLHNLPGATLQVGSNPFLSQVSPNSPKTTTTSVVLTPNVAASFSAGANSAFTAIHGNQIQIQPLTMGTANLLAQSTDQTGSQQVIIQTSVAPAIIAHNTAMQGKTIPQTSLLKPLATNVAAATARSGPRCVAGTKQSLSNALPLAVLIENGELTTAPITAVPTPPIPKARRTKPILEDPGPKRKHKCQYCDKTFGKNFDLQQHVRSHTGEKPFQCIVCGRAFAQKSNVKKHMKTHMVWPQGTGKTLPNQPAPHIISEHDADVEPTEDPFINTTPSTIKFSLNRKVVEGSNEKPVILNVVVDNAYMCQYCSLKFDSYFSLKSHMSIHKDEQVYKCVLKSCSQTFKELDSFLEHTKTHEENMTYRCHLCNKIFPSLYELGVHQYSHSLYPNQGPKPGPRYFRCVKCNNKYSTPEALQHHLDTVSHKHPCPHCPKMFACERYLRRHLPLHGSIGHHQCDFCPKTFKTENYLKVHLLTHSTEKPFGCDMCSAAFNRKDKLKRHQLIHETTKKFKCPFRHHVGCTKAFSRPDKLKAHIICHSGLKPFTCKECNKTFTRRSNLRLHERGHRKDYLHTCQTCGKGFLRDKLFQMHKCRVYQNTPLSAEPQSTVEKPTPAIPCKENPARTTEMSTRRKMLTITKNMVQSRPPKKSKGKRGKAVKKTTAPLVTVPQVVENTTMDIVGDIVTIPAPPYHQTDTQVTEISVVVGEDTTAHYMSQDSIVQDGSVVVIQPLANVQTTSIPLAVDAHTTQQHYEIPIEGSTTQHYEIPVTVETNTTQQHYKMQAELVDQKDIYPVNQEVGTLVSVSGDIVPSYNLEYQTDQQNIYQAAYSNAPTFQSATLIATGPNMATLVVEGPSGEVISQENITTIVAQGPDDYTEDVNGQTYSVLQYPLPGNDDQVTMEATGITNETLVDSVNQALKAEHT